MRGPKNQQCTLFPEMCVIACAHAGTQAGKFRGVIYCTCKYIVLSRFVFLSVHTSCKEKFFIEGFFIKDYIQEI